MPHPKKSLILTIVSAIITAIAWAWDRKDLREEEAYIERENARYSATPTTVRVAFVRVAPLPNEILQHSLDPEDLERIDRRAHESMQAAADAIMAASRHDHLMIRYSVHPRGIESGLALTEAFGLKDALAMDVISLDSIASSAEITYTIVKLAADNPDATLILVTHAPVIARLTGNSDEIKPGEVVFADLTAPVLQPAQ